MQKDDYPDLTSFEDVARHYRQNYASRAEVKMEKWFASQSLTLTEAIERACASVIDGKLYSHQQRPFQRWPQAPKKAADLLKPLASRIAAARDFDDLHTIICTTLASVQGVGPLACYDIAHRIGKWLRPKLEPTEVFLHRGTREGVKALGLWANRDRAPISDFPEGLRRSLTAAQMEDALCIYRGTLARIAGSNGQGDPKTTAHGSTRCVTAPAQARASRPGRC
jgi:hypothetical protein